MGVAPLANIARQYSHRANARILSTREIGMRLGDGDNVTSLASPATSAAAPRRGKLMPLAALLIR